MSRKIRDDLQQACIEFSQSDFDDLPGLDEYLSAAADHFRDPSYYGIYFDDLDLIHSLDDDPSGDDFDLSFTFCDLSS